MSVASAPIRRTRVLFLGEAITLSHVGRPSVLAASLDPARYEVFFACDDRIRPLLGHNDTFHYVPVRSRIHGKDMQSLIELREELYSLETLDAYVGEDLALMRKIRPDIVIGDMRLSLNLSARMAGVPYLNIQSCYWHPSSKLGLRLPASPFPRAVPQSIANGFATLFSPMATLYPNLLAMKYGLPLPGPNFRKTLGDGDHIGFPDIPEWSPLKEAPANATYLGPLLWAPAVADPPWWNEIEDGRPLVYVSLGSSGQTQLLDTILKAVISVGYRVMLATAGRAQVQPVPGSLYVADYLDGRAAAARAVLTICNGGSTAAPQALAVGCPVLGITSNMDQAAFMELLAQTGAGIEVPESQVSSRTVTEALLALRHYGRHRKAAERMQAAIEAIDAPAAFEKAIDACLATRRRSNPAMARASAEAA